MRSLTYTELIRTNRNFRNLLGGQVVAELGAWFNFIAVLGLIRTISGASALAAGTFFICRILPFAFASPFAGTFVDRFSRRTVMIAADLARVGIALAFLLVTSPENLWIAYAATVMLSLFGAFFEGAKNATTPNLTGKEGLLAGTALIFSTRFLLMAIGSALGGWAASIFGYQAAFVINAMSFLVSAYLIWMIPEEATRDDETAKRMSDKENRSSFLTEMREGIHYAFRNHFALTILMMNVIWAIGGGAVNIIFERGGGVYFAGLEARDPDRAVAMLWTASGIGLAAGMLIAHRTSLYLDLRNRHSTFIWVTLVLHGILFAIAGLMPTLLLFSVFVFLSRLLIGVEYAIQETLFQRSLPDQIRGRISTIDRGAELTMFGISSYVAAAMMYLISPMTLTIISGIISALAGIVWFLRHTDSDFKPDEQGASGTNPA
ncbi:MAG: MFS transporter [Acidobacteria bacterium]|nr:MFS transporter [Acidobacteriota bacterium]